MASTTYYTILTKVGQAKIANAIAYGRQLQITQFALGDGGGSGYEPDENQTALKHEVYRANVSNVVVSDQSINMLEVNMAVPADQGGWVVREMGVYDADGDLIAISKTPDDPKPGAGSGAAKDVVYRLFIVVTNTDAVEIKIDPTVAVATKAEVQAAKEQLQAQIDVLSQTLSDEIKVLATIVNDVQNYTAFTDIDPTYTNDTLFATVYNAMVNNSILRTQVSANATDYPADGLLEVIKQDANHGACTLSAADGIYTLTITPENIEQIFGGGVLDKWSKAALEADLAVLSGEVDDVFGNVKDGIQEIKTLINNLNVGDFIGKTVQVTQNWTSLKATENNPTTLLSITTGKPSIAIGKFTVEPYGKYNPGVVEFEITIDGKPISSTLNGKIHHDMFSSGFDVYTDSPAGSNPQYIEIMLPFKNSLVIIGRASSGITESVGVGRTIYIYS